MAAPRWFSVVLLGLALVAGAALLLQRHATEALRSELALLRDENREVARLRAEQQCLKAAEVPAAELERLCADHAALIRLRAEINRLKNRADQKARANASAPTTPARPPGK